MNFPSQTNFYSGKVRDVYTIQDRWLVMIASDRISAFDVILPRPIPFKGQVLNQVAAHMLGATKDICPNWLLETPAPNAAIGIRCEPIRIEMVVRGNLTGHAWRTYAAGKRMLCGMSLPEGMQENDLFDQPIITPSTKAEEGHDEDISREEILERKIVDPHVYGQLESYSLELFRRGREMAARRGLILVDTKYEFGLLNHREICLMDEIHTPDSSRYFYADASGAPMLENGRPKQLSKEFVREWLIENNFMGKEGQTVPSMSDEWVATISRRYIELYEKLIGPFKPEPLGDAETQARIQRSLEKLTG